MPYINFILYITSVDQQHKTQINFWFAKKQQTYDFILPLQTIYIESTTKTFQLHKKNYSGNSMGYSTINIKGAVSGP